jgi:CubicO group peptidase (beta-lactamase class C family)
VVKYLPDFKMSDPWITREIRVRDLLIHNSGLPEGAGDLMLWPEPNLFTRKDILSGLQYLKPSNSFRSHYDYDNTLYIVAGEVAAAAAGVPYEQLIRREVFGPVGMSRCQVGEWKRDEIGNVAQPHMREGDRNVPLRRDGEVVPAIASAPAGGVRCSLNDMLKWARMWLDPDVRPGASEAPWISAAQHEALWTPHTPMPLSQRQKRWDDGHFLSYGYGWRLSDVDGQLRVAHTGTLSGMYSALTLLPEQKTGFVFLINGEGSEARTVLNQALVKQFTAPRHAQGHAPSVRWYIDQLAQERADKLAKAAASSTATTPGVAASAPASAPALASTPMREIVAPDSISQWLGLYRDPWFGEISICPREGRVTFRSVKSPMMTGEVLRIGARLFVDWDDDSVDVEPWLDFKAGKPITLTMAKSDPEGDFSSDYEDLSFTRTGNCKPEPKVAALSADQALAQVDALMHDYAGDNPGASVLVLRDGKPLIRKAYGRANLEAPTAATPQTNYRLASVTKQFTSASILLLAQAGKLRLEDPIQKWLPSLPQATHAITIRHLLTHTSGLIDYEDSVPDSAPQVHDADVLRLLEKENRTYFAPGSSYRYSNSGYALLSLIVEKASGQRFALFLHDHLFQPLGMSGTVAFEEGVSTVANRAFGYSTTPGGAWSRTDQSSTSAVLGDGGIYSSIDDLAKWDAALYDDRLLNPESRKLAFTPATKTDNASVQYGMGWRITADSLWHSGETMGFRNVIVRFPKRHLTVIVLTNRNDPEPYRAALAISRLFLRGDDRT